ncbi:MAG: HAD-IIIA family hydrolase [Methylobacillus sp.]|jgi:phosphoglycolate phosphatase|nr:HAD-IIIA family hydrolase [Methylobacillus sp.]
MPQQFDLIVFDWDGTLSDSTHAIAVSVQEAAKDAGLPIPSDAAARSIIGLELHRAITVLLPDADETQLNLLAERYRAHFLTRSHGIALFDGVVEAIKQLAEQGVMLAVATGKTRRGLERAFAESGLRPYFQASRCADECFSKPHPQMLLEIMDELNIAPERTLMIGDTSFDLQMANNAGVHSLAVTYGAQPLENLLACEPLAHFDNFAQVWQWLKTNA